MFQGSVLYLSIIFNALKKAYLLLCPLEQSNCNIWWHDKVGNAQPAIDWNVIKRQKVLSKSTTLLTSNMIVEIVSLSGHLEEGLQSRKLFGSKIEACWFFIPTDYIYPICYMYLPSFRGDIDTYKWIIIILVIKMQA